MALNGINRNDKVIGLRYCKRCATLLRPLYLAGIARCKVLYFLKVHRGTDPGFQQRCAAQTCGNPLMCRHTATVMRVFQSPKAMLLRLGSEDFADVGRIELVPIDTSQGDATLKFEG